MHFSVINGICRAFRDLPDFWLLVAALQRLPYKYRAVPVYVTTSELSQLLGPAEMRQSCSPSAMRVAIK